MRQTLYEQIKLKTEGRRKSKNWYRSQLFSSLDPIDEYPQVGRMYFFSYGAKFGDELEYWDRYPLVYVTSVSYTTGHFTGGNLHYVRPVLRVTLGKMFQSGTEDYPPRMHHKYIIDNTSGLFSVPEPEWGDIGKLPVEEFVTNVNGKYMTLPSSFVWSRP
jgi:hypothetical protein